MISETRSAAKVEITRVKIVEYSLFEVPKVKYEKS